MKCANATICAKLSYEEKALMQNRKNFDHEDNNHEDNNEEALEILQFERLQLFSLRLLRISVPLGFVNMQNV